MKAKSKTRHRIARLRMPQIAIALVSVFFVRQVWSFPPFSVQGTLTYEVPGRPTLSGHFTVGLSNTCWHVTVVQDQSTGFRSFEYNYDGTDNLQYCLSKKTGSDVGSALIEPGPVPSSTGTDAGDVIWLAYASGFYFHSLAAGSARALDPLRSPHGRTLRYELPAEWKLGASEPFLPIEISYYATNVFVLEDSGNLISVPLDKRRSPRYLAAHLQTSDMVTFQGVEVPRRFEYITYGPWPKPGTLGRTAIVRGNATNICPLVDFPPIPGTLHIEDRRVPEPSVVYKVTNGTPPSLETSFVTNARAMGRKRFENSVGIAKLTLAPHSARTRWFARALILFVALAPVLLYVAQRVGRR
jgi:hypothetical protein